MQKKSNEGLYAWRYLTTANNLFLVSSLLAALSGFLLGIYGAGLSKESKNVSVYVNSSNLSGTCAMNGTKDGGSDDDDGRKTARR